MSAELPELAALRAIAEDPLALPSGRLEARKAIRAYRAAAEGNARTVALAATSRAKIAKGEPLTLRERQGACLLGLISRAGRCASER